MGWLSLGIESQLEIFCIAKHLVTIHHWQISDLEVITMVDKLIRLFLKPSGWTRSKSQNAPVRINGEPLPWYTYGAIEFLHRVVRTTDRVFEYGAGYSTLWWQKRVEEMCSVEHDEAWCMRLSPNLLPHVQLYNIKEDYPVPIEVSNRVAPFFGRRRRSNWPYTAERVRVRGLADERFLAYAHQIVEFGGKFDFIVIDGMARRLCTFLAIDCLKSDGFIILDNSNRSDYDLAYTLLEESGFRQIPFLGLVPGANFFTCTSFFTRSLERLPSSAYIGNSFDLPEY